MLFFRKKILRVLWGVKKLIDILVTLSNATFIRISTSLFLQVRFLLVRYGLIHRVISPPIILLSDWNFLTWNLISLNKERSFIVCCRQSHPRNFAHIFVAHRSKQRWLVELTESLTRERKKDMPPVNRCHCTIIHIRINRHTYVLFPAYNSRNMSLDNVTFRSCVIVL